MVGRMTPAVPFLGPQLPVFLNHLHPGQLEVDTDQLHDVVAFLAVFQFQRTPFTCWFQGWSQSPR